MAHFKQRYSIVVEATQWFQNGDHPLDNQGEFTDPETGEMFLGEGKVVRYFRLPDGRGKTTVCGQCSHLMHDHGWMDNASPTTCLDGSAVLDGRVVCPGSWIITTPGGPMYACPPELFNQIYEPKSDNDLEDDPKRQEVPQSAAVALDKVRYPTMDFSGFGGRDLSPQHGEEDADEEGRG